MKEYLIEDLLIFFRTRFGIEITDDEYDLSFSDIGIDSLSIYSTIDELEEKTNIKISNDKLFELNTIRKLYEAICMENK